MQYESYTSWPKILQRVDIDQLCNIYQRVFYDSRWKETHDPTQIRRRFTHEMTIPNTFPLLLLAKDGPQIVGFGWGYSAPPATIASEIVTGYFPSHAPQISTISHHIQEHTPPPSQPLFVSEYGLIENLRKTTSSIDLLIRFCRTCLAASHSTHVSWTHRTKSGIYPPVLASGGYEIYDFKDNLVIITGLFSALRDYAQSLQGHQSS